MNEIEMKIENILRRGIRYANSRCRDISYKVRKRLPKKIRDKLVLVEGNSHYRLEDNDGNRYDVYAELIDHLYSEEDYREVSRYDLTKLERGTDYDEKFTFSSKGGDSEKLEKVFYFSNESLERARL